MDRRHKTATQDLRSQGMGGSGLSSSPQISAVLTLGPLESSLNPDGLTAPSEGTRQEPTALPGDHLSASRPCPAAPTGWLSRCVAQEGPPGSPGHRGRHPTVPWAQALCPPKLSEPNARKQRAHRESAVRKDSREHKSTAQESCCTLAKDTAGPNHQPAEKQRAHGVGGCVAHAGTQLSPQGWDTEALGSLAEADCSNRSSRDTERTAQRPQL